MSNIEEKIRNHVETFARELAEMVREDALDGLRVALGGRLGAKVPRAARAAGKSASRGRGRERPKGAKRNPKEIEATLAKVLAYVKRFPDSNVETIAQGLHVSTRDLVLPINKAIASGVLGKKGTRRATRYHLKAAAPK